MIKQLLYFFSASKFASQMPGFRTGTPWKQVLAMIGYPVLMVITYVYLSFQMNYVSTFRDGILLGINNLVVVLCMILIPFILITNLKNIRKRLPLFKQSSLSRQLIASTITIIILFSITGIVTTTIDNFYSNSFNQKVSMQKP